MKEYKTFSEFYPFYLREHANPVNRVLHFLGSLTGLSVVIAGPWFFGIGSIGSFGRIALFCLMALVCGYTFAWVGHFIFEKNRPATFKYPWFSFLGDWVMFKDLLIGREKFFNN